MNNTFNLSRFGKVLRSDCRKYFRNFGITLAILCGLNLVLWLLTLIFNISMPTIARYAIIYIAELLAIIMVPAKAFGDNARASVSPCCPPPTWKSTSVTSSSVL